MKRRLYIFEMPIFLVLDEYCTLKIVKSWLRKKGDPNQNPFFSNV